MKDIISAMMEEAAFDRSHGRCPSCKDRIHTDEFKDELSVKEFGISGLCQTCQDKIFEVTEVL